MTPKPEFRSPRIENALTRNSAYLLAVMVVLAALTRIVAFDRSRPQGFDEPAHIAAGMEWLQFHSYRLDPLHPPLSRLAIAIPLYASGVRLADMSQNANFWAAGNSVLNQGDYLGNLARARYGVLPFVALLLVVIFDWTRRRFGELTGLAAVAMFSTLPIILAFSSLAYTDLPAACMQVASLFAFADWMEKPAWRSSIFMGALFGLAVLTKFTSLLYLPAGAVAIVIARRLSNRRKSVSSSTRSEWIRQCVVVAFLSLIVIWAGYGFSFGHIDETLHVTPANMPSFQHFPAPVRAIARNAVTSDWVVPTPALLAGLADAWVLNKSAPSAYLFGKQKSGGWWYFFLAEILFKTPLPFLLLATLGFIPLFRRFRDEDWKAIVPAAGAVSILLLSTAVTTNYGLRHVLIVFPLLAVIAGCGVSWLWMASSRWRLLGRTFAIALLTWQCAAALRPGSDPIAYFNELAGHDPSHILVSGCDFDCGQDLLALSAELRRRNAEHVSLAVWSSADLSRLGLPAFEVIKPFQPTSGWVAVSVRAAREGSVLHESYPAGAFDWLNRYQPVSLVGKTIKLYHIPLINRETFQAMKYCRVLKVDAIPTAPTLSLSHLAACIETIEQFP